MTELASDCSVKKGPSLEFYPTRPPAVAGCPWICLQMMFPTRLCIDLNAFSFRLRFFRGISSAVELQVSTQVGILTAPEQRLRVTRKTFAGDKHFSCLSPSVLRAQPLQKDLLPLCSAHGVLTFRNQLPVLKAPLTRTSSDSPPQLWESLSGTTVSIPGIVSRSCSQRGFSSTSASSEAEPTIPSLAAFGMLRFSVILRVDATMGGYSVVYQLHPLACSSSDQAQLQYVQLLFPSPFQARPSSEERLSPLSLGAFMRQRTQMP